MTTFKAKIPQAGARGPAGNAIIEVANVPPGAEAGAIGDVALRYDDNGETWLYGKKTEGGWPTPPRALRGLPGAQGQKGWSPLIAVEAVSDDRLALRLLDWVGGQGAKPDGAGKYFGMQGLVDSSAEALVWGYSALATSITFENLLVGLPSGPKHVQGAIRSIARKAFAPNVRDREYVTSKKWFSGSSAANNGWIGLDYSPEQNLYVAVASDGADRVMMSKDGRTWTSVNVPTTVWRTVRWIRELGRWIATGHGTSGAMWSADGVTWNAVTTPDGEWVNFAYSSTLNLLVANNRASPSSIPNAGQSMVSSDGGETWTLNALPVNNDWLGTCWSDDLEKFIIVGSPNIDSVDEDPYVLTSMDGYNWMGHAIANLEHWWNAIWVPELQLFVAAANNNDPTAGIMTSPDGETWTARTTPSGSWYDLAWSPSLGLLVCVANSGSNRVMYSTDGIEWVAGNPPNGVTTGAQAWRKVVWSEPHKQFVAVATSGTGNRAMVSAPLLPAKFENANGSYTVFPDGTMEAKRQVVVDLTTTSAQIFDMPATFADFPTMGWNGGPGSIASGDTAALGDVWVYDTLAPPTSRWIFRAKTAGATAAYNVQLWARGLWD